MANPQAEVLALAPDGERVAVAVARHGDDAAVLAIGVATGDPFAAPDLATSFPDGTHAIAAAWSPDGSTLAVVSTSRPDAATPAARTSNDLWMVARDGSTRHVSLPPADDAVRADGGVRWAPGGEHLAVGWQTVRRNAFEEHTYDFVLLKAADGSLVGSGGWTTGGLESVFFSPDAAKAAYPGGGTIQIVNLDGSGTIVPDIGLRFGPEAELVWLP